MTKLTKLHADLAQSLLLQRTAVHEDLRDDRQTRVDDVRLVDVEQKLRVLDDVHPETQQQAAPRRHITPRATSTVLISAAVDTGSIYLAD